MPDPPATGPPFRADDLTFLRKQAKALLRAARERNPAAVARFRSVLGANDDKPPTLSRAQLVIARETGFGSWPKLRDELRWRKEVRAKHRLGSATLLKTGATMNSNQSLNLGAIDQIGLTCTDLDEAQRFYRDLLGLKLAADVPSQMKFFGCDGVNIVLFKSDKISPNSCIYFRVPGEEGLLEKKLDMLKAKGVKVESDAHVIARNWKGM
jgi:predicted enzyme related to lactoylglutathione lyase